MATPSTYPSHGSAVTNGYTDSQATAAAALSQHNGDEVQTNGRKRKAPGAPGSRGVANLTPEQLAKKRANDREAQRAIRERTRNTIETLERRIRELESQQPFQELQRAIAERDAALRDCEELRRRLATVAQVVGSNIAEGGLSVTNGAAAQGVQASLNELAALGAQQTPLPTSVPSTSLGPYQTAPYPSHAGSGGFNDTLVHPDLRSPASYSSGTPLTHGSPGTGQPQGSTLMKWSPSLEPLNHAQQVPPAQMQQHGQTNGGHYEHEQASQQLQPPAQLQQPVSNSDRCDLRFLLDSNGSPNAQAPAMAYPQTSAQPELLPVHARQPYNTPPSSPLDSLLSDFIANRRAQVKAGVPVHEVLGPEYPDFTALRDQGVSSTQPCHPVSTLLIDVLSKFPDISQLSERVAVLYVMFLLVRWFISLDEACYERLPEWAKPVTEQLERPHALWNDLLPWPFMRKRLVTAASPVKFDEFFVPYTASLSLNWPYPTDQVLIPDTAAALGEGSLVINPVFEAHLRDLRHWSLGSDFQQAFPDLVNDAVRDDGPPDV
ncbi:hypothetical protein BAUCODRAFT_120757 [Baudoinia panamericana UAMH 10762]|uniref:BZIP domain-containing protein n=1 Tax=Baudoinia panamericana (strain UAMH 10762) TaxID=717646 RepID=M2LTG5_BAUPA|nr:uncharacterized protein BAUCODRAFT_120757 [Baudoinia panamericana UAMH 10762]EMC97827.1 hypothetical protein BAUCODRAFT_120757 [Baudoinia panamericana UAMH 10762]